MTDTNLLMELINQKGLKLKAIAKALDLSPYGLSNKIHNRTEFTTSEVDQFCRMLDIHDLALKEKVFFAQKDDYKST